ncbi:Na+/proline symporter [Roseiarcus fermentans]|uniref:histidine kinase n=1 Tax=Roseiarcus fermentans TaxID=1473586 RepID=A0A366FGD7_9HYPH|nr:hybrid sensor histidine kinase/response regulator [Roseiarcus fermentans]RBP13742.1 Na+/proline symporter [Roseiarcus fermentans]
MNGATAAIAAIGYVLFLFLIAWWGDRGGRRFIAGGPRAVVYALSLAVYCTSWTYYGSVGLASSRGLDFLPIYIGPILVIGLGSAFVGRIASLARAQNLTTVADFVSARYGKSQRVAAVAALIALVGSAPYVALQLKAVSTTLLTVVASLDKPALVAGRPSAPFSLAIALVLAVFAIAFGTRRLNPKERQEGLILAIAVESIVKLAAFLAVGVFVVWGMNGGLADLTQAALSNPKIAAVVQTRPDPAVWGVTTLLSAFAILLLPRQFHVAVVENHDRADIRTASWLFPAYLVLINLFVAPLAIAGLTMFPDGAIDRDLTVLALPLAAHAHGLALFTMIGGLSAATGMIVVDSLALAITISNDLVMPLLLRRKAIPTQGAAAGDIGALALWVRRLSILGVLGLGFAYERLTSETALVSIGLLSFAAVAQIGPAFIGGLFWRRGTARGALAGMAAGSLAWLYLLLLPSLGSHAAIAAYLEHGPLAIAWLSPTGLTAFAPSPLVGGVVVSLGLNLAAFVAFSLLRQPTALERAQANAFAGAGGKPQAFRLWRSSTTAGELEAAVARYLGAARARRAFAAFVRERGQDYDPEQEASAQLIRHAEFLLSPAIGASTSRQVLSLLLRPRAVSTQSALKLIDEASAAIQSSRDQLQHALDHARQGVTVFDSNLALTAWNREFADLFDLPQALLRHGVGLDEIVRFNAARGAYGPGDSEDFVAERVASLLYDDQPTRLRLFSTHRVIEIRSARLPDGGIVTTYTDITQTVQTEEALEAANEFLERRVDERTAELQRLNAELAAAKTVAEEANLSKTRFLAAASHDILQPLNAARLYASSLVEGAARGGDDRADLARKVDMSLEAVEEILGALLDISRLDAGATRPELSDTPVADLMRMLEVEFAPLALSKGLALRMVPTRLAVRTDRRLMRRLLQNLVSNAVKYTVRGKVLVGCRRVPGALRIEVWDTGLGIPADRQRVVFEEFQRLDQGARIARGLGLGLSIVERLGRVLDHPVGLASRPGAGSVFHVTAPLAAAAPARPEAADVVPAAVAGEPLSGLKILAIDNEPRVLDGMRTLLGRWGCLVVTANGLAEAREALGGFGPPDLVIADYHLDKSDGIAAILALRADLGLPLPAILATADRSPEARDEAARHDIVILHKPLKPAPLRAQLARMSALRDEAAQ